VNSCAPSATEFTSDASGTPIRSTASAPAISPAPSPATPTSFAAAKSPSRSPPTVCASTRTSPTCSSIRSRSVCARIPPPYGARPRPTTFPPSPPARSHWPKSPPPPDSVRFPLTSAQSRRASALRIRSYGATPIAANTRCITRIGSSGCRAASIARSSSSNAATCCGARLAPTPALARTLPRHASCV